MFILPCVFFTFNWFDIDLWNAFCDVSSCLLSRGKRKYATLETRLWWKKYLLVYHWTSHFLSYLQNYKQFADKISDLQSEKCRFSFETKIYSTFSWNPGDDNVISIRASKYWYHTMDLSFPFHSCTFDDIMMMSSGFKGNPVFCCCW